MRNQFLFFSILLCNLMPASVQAFTINPANSNMPPQKVGALTKYENSKNYVIGPSNYVVNLKPSLVTQVDNQGRKDFKKFLDTSIYANPVTDGGFGYSFNLKAAGELKGTFDIQNYYACPPPDPPACGIKYKDTIDVHSMIGAFLDITLSYDPKADGQPKDAPLETSLRWIQRVKYNHSIDTNKHGDKDDRVDSDGLTPFYPPVPFRPSLFVDNPRRS